MTMTAFITHCWKNTRLDLAAVLACVCLAWGLPRPAHAQVPAAEVTQLRFERSNDGILLSASVKFELPQIVEDALLKGVPMFFVAEVEVFRERWYWTDKKVVSAERHMRLIYHPLTRRWRLNVASGVITSNSLGVALNQTFDTLADALATVQRLSRWKIADVSDIDLEQRHNVEFRFRLDVSQLPRPLQIGALGQADWVISASARHQLVTETLK